MPKGAPPSFEIFESDPGPTSGQQRARDGPRASGTCRVRRFRFREDFPCIVSSVKKADVGRLGGAKPTHSQREGKDENM